MTANYFTDHILSRNTFRRYFIEVHLEYLHIPAVYQPHVRQHQKAGDEHNDAQN